MLLKNGYSEAHVSRISGRILIEGVPLEAASIVARVFGVVYAIPAEETDSLKESIINLAVKIADKSIKLGDTFAVRARVVGEHEYGSQDLAGDIGFAILDAIKNRNIKVNLTNPSVTVRIEVRDRSAYIFTNTHEGFSGLPYGTQGEAVSLFSGGIDSPVATWLMMKRGVSTFPLFMDQTPYVGASYLERATEAFKAIKNYVPTDKFHLWSAPMGPLMKKITESPEPKFTCILCKRCMYRIAELFSQNCGAKAIITGESLGQVASQTLDNLNVLTSAVNIPIFRPLIGFDKVQIEDIARKIGTYDITARHVDGCKVVPSSPATKSNLIKIQSLEAKLDLITLCSEATEKIESKAID